MAKKEVTCPICKKETFWDDDVYRPFCSDRCRLIDLGEWASGKYQIVGDKKVPRDADHKTSNKA